MSPSELSNSSPIKARFSGKPLLVFCATALVLVGCGRIDKVSQLITRLKDPGHEVRLGAAKVLGDVKDPRARSSP